MCHNMYGAIGSGGKDEGLRVCTLDKNMHIGVVTILDISGI